VLGKRVERFEWQLVADAEPLLTGGLGKTPQAATADALKLALWQVSESFSVARVEYLRVEQYPWFYVGTVAVYPRAIRQDAVLPLPAQPVAAQPDHSTTPPPLDIVNTGSGSGNNLPLEFVNLFSWQQSTRLFNEGTVMMPCLRQVISKSAKFHPAFAAWSVNQ
jgi:hypothetical protein